MYHNHHHQGLPEQRNQPGRPAQLEEHMERVTFRTAMKTRQTLLGLKLRDFRRFGLSPANLHHYYRQVEEDSYNVRTLHRLAMLFHVPPQVLMMRDPSAILNAPYPPEGWFERLSEHAEEAGLMTSSRARPCSWERYLEIIAEPVTP
jgi:hypothetical protein